MKHTVLDDKLLTFYESIAFRDDDILRGLRDATAALPESMMQIAPSQGQLMQLLVGMVCASRPTNLGPARVLEVGTFTGYSTLCMARALPEDGTVIACDTSDQWTSIGQQFWAKAGVASKIDLRINPALETLAALRTPEAEGTFDAAFIDADKSNYDGYYEHALALCRAGGLIMVDNIFWGGRSGDPTANDADTIAIRAIAKKIATDPRVETTCLPIADGLTLARKK